MFDFVLQVYDIDIADERYGSKSVPSWRCFVLIPFSDKFRVTASQEYTATTKGNNLNSFYPSQKNIDYRDCCRV